MEVIAAMRANGILYSYLKHHRQEDKTWLLPTNICPEVVLTFFKAGCRLKFTDIEEKELGMNLYEAEYILEHNDICGLLYNHTYGNEYTPDNELTEIKDKYPGLFMIDDRCLCDPKFEFKSKWADIILFSTNSRKQVDLDYGGYCYAHKDFLIKSDVGYNHKIYKEMKPDLNGMINFNSWYKLAQKPWLDTSHFKETKEIYFMEIEKEREKWFEHKNELTAIYKKEIPSIMQLGQQFNNWRFQVISGNKKVILKELSKKGLFAGDHYRSLGTYIEEKSFPVAEKIENTVLNLFIDNNYDQFRAHLTAGIFNRINPV